MRLLTTSRSRFVGTACPHNQSLIMKTFVLATALTTLLCFQSAFTVAHAWECPKFDEDKIVAILQVCVADDAGLCGEQCIEALVAGSLEIKDTLKVPCDGGIDGVMENVLKRCTEENGAQFDPCDGKVKSVLRSNAENVQCLEGGTLADYL